MSKGKDLNYWMVCWVFTPFSSFTVLDWNGDGMTDVYAVYSVEIRNPSHISDRLWMGQTSDYNFLALQCVSPFSNQNFLGLRAELHGFWGVQCREIRKGESYGIQNDATMIFGLGNHTRIDSLVLYWPGGEKQILTKLENQFELPDQFTTMLP